MSNRDKAGLIKGNDGWVVKPLGPSPLGGGDTHDTFQVDSDGNVSGGHFTVQNPGGQKINVPWSNNLG